MLVRCVREVIAVGDHQAHPKLYQQPDSKLLSHQIASKAAGVLNKHHTDAVALNTVEQCREARPALDRVGMGRATALALAATGAADCLMQK